MSKNKIEKKIPFHNPTHSMIIWVISLIIFHGILYFSKNDLSTKTIWTVIFLLNILIGILTFIRVIILILRNLVAKVMIKRSLFYFLIMLSFALIFFYSLTLTNNHTSKTNNANNQKRRCYFDSYRWTTIDENENCEEIVKTQLEAEKEARDSLIENQKNQAKTVKTKPSSTTNNNWEEAWKVEKIDDKTTDTRFPEDDRMGTAEELFVAINNYRQAHDISTVQKHDTLCRIAQTRANQLLELGKLDSHAGMDSLAHSQQDFDNMGEVISGGTQKELAVHTVEWGWGRSLTGHKESILNRKWTHGCGGVSGLFSVFVFGAK